MNTMIKLLFLLTAVSTLAMAQTRFVKYQGSPVLGIGGAGAWDNPVVQTGSIIFDGTTYRQWYHESDGSHMGIGYAMSSDGVHWSKYPANPVFVPGGTSGWISAVLQVGDTLHLYYVRQPSSDVCDAMHATSVDGVSWTPDVVHNPISLRGAGGAWDDYYADARVVLKPDSTWMAWYIGAARMGMTKVGYAYSRDGVTWTKPSSFPVLGQGSSGAWDNYNVAVSDVHWTGSEFRMWYSSNWSVGYATSVDGRLWTKYPKNPIFTEEGKDANAAGVGACRVLQQGSVTKMWYDQLPNAGIGGKLYQIGLAVDSDSGYVMADPFTVPFNPCLVGASGEIRKIRIKNYGRSAATVSTITLGSVNFSIVDGKPLPRILGPGAADTVSVQFSPATSGWCFDSLRITSTSAVDTVFTTDLNGLGKTSGIEVRRDPTVPSVSTLLPNFPNPFNPTTTLAFAVGEGDGKTPVKLAVYDLLGREVTVLMDEIKQPGTYHVTWSAAGLASGVYICRLSMQGFRASNVMTLLK
jgi:hypothetical protein